MRTRLLIVSFFVLCPHVLAWAYTPPIGIPDPGSWGSIHPIDSLAPDTNVKCSSWPSGESPGCYYIEASHLDCTDSGNTYGYPTHPRCSIPGGTFGPGSYMEIQGTMAYSNVYTQTWNCIEADPCWIRGTSEVKAYITGEMRLTNSEYLLMENMDFDGGAGAAISITGNGNNIIVRNSDIKNRTYPGVRLSTIGITPDLNATISDVVIYNVNFQNNGDWQATGDEDFTGITPNTWGRNTTTFLHHVWILNCNWFRQGGSGVIINGGLYYGSHDSLHHIYVGRCTGNQNNQAPVFVKQSSDVILSENIFHDHRSHDTHAPGDCAGAQYNPKNLWVIYNKFYDANYGFRNSDNSTVDSEGVTHDWYRDHSIYIIGNIIHNIHPEIRNPSSPTRQGVALAMWQGNNNKYIIDNTIYDVDGGILIYQKSAGSYAWIYGNIVSTIYSLDWQFQKSYNFGNGNWWADYNIFYDASIGTRLHYDGNTINGIDNFVSASGQCIDCLDIDPEFIMPGSDFTPQSGSGAIGANIESSVYDTFFGLYGLSIKIDRAGTVRPQNTTWDIGAYEYTTGETDTTDPVLSALIPSGAQSCSSNPRNVTLSLTCTDAVGCTACKADTADVDIDSMAITLTQGGTTWSGSTGNLACGASYTYYGKCEDAADNESAASEWNFSIAAAVAAAIGGAGLDSLIGPIGGAGLDSTVGAIGGMGR